mmetsp:Transcript_4254/g.5848  ORF Transcript_4254/g.5848 Transcript_4254/m.5848 type:complete len:298 (+) Transcript_4254:21-914(+)
MISEPDELFTLRTLYWLGSFQAAINEANTLSKLSSVLIAEKEEYIYRSFLALGQYGVVTSEIKENKPNTSVGLRAIKLLATYLENPSNNEIVMLQMKEWLSNPVASGNKTVQIIAATLFMYEDNMKEAFKVIKSGSSMEQHALLVQMYLKIDRLDLAQKQLKTMKSLDEDSTLSMLSSAWINLSVGVGKAQDAAYIYEELIDKYGASAALLNGLAVAKMQQGQFDEAEVNLQEALTKAPSDADSLANLICVSHHLQRTPEVINRYLSQLKIKAPQHSLVVALNTFNGAFDRVASTLA